MNDKALLLTIASLILLISFLWIPNPEMTGFTISEGTVSPLSINLDATTFAVDAPITGTLSITLSEELNPEETFTISFNGKTDTYTIEEILNKANNTIEYESSEFDAINEAPEKTITFAGKETQFLGLKIPRYAEVEEVTFNVEAQASDTNYPTAVSMDFGNDGIMDWYYLGTFQSYNTTRIVSEDFDWTKEGTGYVEANTYYCESLSLPKTKHLTIAANYTKLGTDGDLEAVILSVPTQNPTAGWSGGSDTCNLPESGTNSCTINLEYTIEGDYLICIYTTGDDEETTLYEIPLDSSEETTTSYTCPVEQNSVCKETTFANFFFFTQTGIYDNTMMGTIQTENWETFADAILTGLKYFVGSSGYNGLCKTTTCIIPVNISSETSGLLTVKDLSIIYDYNDITQETNALYDLTMPKANITAIEGQELEKGTTLELELELFNLTEPTIGEYTLDISFLGTTTTAALNIALASEILDASTLIERATTTLNALIDKNTEDYLILQILDKTTDITETLEILQTLKNQIGFTDESLLIEEIEETLSTIPWEITTMQTTTEILTPRISDIPTTLGNEEEIYAIQNAITVEGTIKTVVIQNYNLEETSYILIKKEITANQDLKDATLYEIFPIAFTKLFSNERPTTSTGTEAQYSISLNKGQKKELYYLTTEAVSLNDFQSIIVFEQEEEEKEPEKEKAFCGDAFCATDENTESCPADCKEDFSLWYISIAGALLILFLVLFFILWKRKKKKRF